MNGLIYQHTLWFVALRHSWPGRRGSGWVANQVGGRLGQSSAAGSRAAGSAAQARRLAGLLRPTQQQDKSGFGRRL